MAHIQDANPQGVYGLQLVPWGFGHGCGIALASVAINSAVDHLVRRDGC